MDITLLVSGGAYTALLLALSIISLNLTTKAVQVITDKRLHLTSGLKERNTAVAMCYAGFILSVTLMMKSSIASGMSNLHARLYDASASAGAIVSALSLICIQFMIAYAFALFAILVSMRLYARITTDIDEIAEIENGNVAMAVVLSSILVAVSLFISPGVEMIVGSIIPFSEH